MGSRGTYGFKLFNGRTVMTHHQLDMQPAVHGRTLAAEAIVHRHRTRQLDDALTGVAYCPPLDTIRCEGCPCDHPSCSPRWCYVEGRRFNIAGHFTPDGRPKDPSVVNCPVYHLTFHQVGGPTVNGLTWRDLNLGMFEQFDLYPRPSFVDLAGRPEIHPPEGDYEYQYVWDLRSNTLHTYEGTRLSNSNSLAHPSALSALARWAGVDDYLSVRA